MTKKINLFILFFASVLITGLPLWLTSYQELTAGNIIKVSGALSIAITWVAGVLPGKQYLKIVSAVSGGFFMAYVIKIIIDLINNPTDHNLWPFELVIIAFIIICVTSAGIALAWITRKCFRFS
ncbi:MAG: hypothetical protein V4557_08510 [Bacteroidota bacterium]